MSKQSSVKLMTQVHLIERKVDAPRVVMTTWVDRELKEGQLIKLKGNKKEWFVEHVYSTHPLHEINDQKWDNNI